MQVVTSVPEMLLISTACHEPEHRAMWRDSPAPGTGVPGVAGPAGTEGAPSPTPSTWLPSWLYIGNVATEAGGIGVRVLDASDDPVSFVPPTRGRAGTRDAELPEALFALVGVVHHVSGGTRVDTPTPTLPRPCAVQCVWGGGGRGQNLWAGGESLVGKGV